MSEDRVIPFPSASELSASELSAPELSASELSASELSAPEPTPALPDGGEAAPPWDSLLGDSISGDDAFATDTETDPPRDVDAPTLLRRRDSSASVSAAAVSTEGGSVVPFRRRRGDRRIRRLRRHPLVRWVGPLAQAVVLVAVPVLFAAWIVFSPRFALAEIAVSADPAVDDAGRVDARWVEATLAPFLGESIWTLSLDHVESALRRHPWIADVSLRRTPPSGLEVRVRERVEVALWRRDESESTARLVYVDAQGHEIAPFDPADDRSVDLPLFTGAGGDLASAVALLTELEAVAPSWLAGLSEVEILGATDFRVHTADLPFPLLLRRDIRGRESFDHSSLEQKCRYLRALLPRLVERFEAIDAVDLRFARRIIIEPATKGRDLA